MVLNYIEKSSNDPKPLNGHERPHQTVIDPQKNHNSENVQKENSDVPVGPNRQTQYPGSTESTTVPEC